MLVECIFALFSLCKFTRLLSMQCTAAAAATASLILLLIGSSSRMRSSGIVVVCYVVLA